MSKVDSILEQIGMLRLGEATELKEKIGERFGVKFPPPIDESYVPPIVEVEDTVAPVYLTSFGPTDKMNVLKLLRELFLFGLKDAKDKVDTLPSLLVAESNREEFQALQEKFRPFGGVLRHGS